MSWTEKSYPRDLGTILEVGTQTHRFKLAADTSVKNDQTIGDDGQPRFEQS